MSANATKKQPSTWPGLGSPCSDIWLYDTSKIKIYILWNLLVMDILYCTGKVKQGNLRTHEGKIKH
uniref:Uncharacterized protein n=1 Tax=Anguilla anguilla TaxID=7936 RepID=A0A0E9WFH3_ANGAN